MRTASTASKVFSRVLSVVGVFSAIGVGAGLYYRTKSSSEKKPTIVAPPEIPQTVSAWGRLAPQSDVIPLSAAANQFVACVEKLKVSEGDSIVIGQEIAVLDSNRRRQAVVDEAAARVATARAKLAMARGGAKPEEIAVQQALIEVSQAEFDDAKQQYDRGAGLVSSQSISQEDQAARLTRLKKAAARLVKPRTNSIRLRIHERKISPMRKPKWRLPNRLWPLLKPILNSRSFVHRSTERFYKLTREKERKSASKGSSISATPVLCTPSPRSMKKISVASKSARRRKFSYRVCIDV